MLKYNKFYSEAFFVLSGQICTTAVVFVQFFFVVNTLSVTSFGTLLLLLSPMAILYIIFVDPFGRAVCRIKSYEQLSVSSCVRTYFTPLLLLTLLGSSLIYSVLNTFFLDFNFTEQQKILATCIASVTVINNVLLAILNEERKRGVVAAVRVSEAMLRFGYIVYHIPLNLSIEKVLEAYFYAAIVSLLLASLFCLKTKDSKHLSSTAKRKKSVIAIAAPSYALSILVWIRSSSDRWILGAYFSPELLGSYGSIVQLFYAPFVILAGAVYSLLSPIFNQINHLNDFYLLSPKRNIIPLLGLILLVSMILVFSSDIAILLLGQEYSSAIQYTPIVAMSGIITVFCSGLEAKFLADFRQWELIAPKLVSAVVALICFYSLPLVFGVGGAFCSLLLIQLSYLIFLLNIIRRREV